MRRKTERTGIADLAEELVCGRSNDAVKLAFLEDDTELDSLDLRQLSEIKRGANGVIEIKLINRLEALALLTEIAGGDQRSSGGESFLEALCAAAAKSPPSEG